MNHCLWICRKCPKRLVVTYHGDGDVAFYKCFDRDSYDNFVKTSYQASVMQMIFALDSKTGKFLSPFEEFRDVYWRPLPYVERRKIRMGDRKFLKLIEKEKNKCEMFPEMQLTQWSREK